MNDQLINDIQKHNNKINRILNKLCERYPGIVQQIDLALYSCLKIQKIIKKHQQQNKNVGQKDKLYSNQNNDSNIYLTEQQQLYQNALTIIDCFKGATKKLQNKIGILLRQQQLHKQVQKAKYNNGMEAYYELPRTQLSSLKGTAKAKRNHISTYENQSPFSPHIVQESHKKSNKKQYISSNSKNKSSRQNHRKYVQQYINQSESFDRIPDINQSKNISQLDQQIIELTSKITHVIKGQ